MKTFGLFPHPEALRRPDGVRRVLSLLSEGDARLLCPDDRADFAAAFPGVLPVSPETFWGESDFVVPLGGDGTILAASPEAAKWKKPLFGINLGHVGFLAACSPDEEDKIRRLLRNDVIPSRRMMLSLFVNGEKRATALNEILLAPCDRGKLLSGVLSVNGRRMTDFRADAVLFHTPTGSTSYAFSAGGAVCGEEMELIGFQAVAPYMRRGGHHMLFSPDAVFAPEELSCSDGMAEAVADGRAPVSLLPGDRVEIRRCENDLTLCYAEHHDNQQIICEKIREAGREKL